MEDYKQIDLNDYVQTGEGGTALTYSRKDGKTLAKLYKPGFEADRAKAEFLTARTVYELGIPTPEPFRLVTDGERYGAEYELIKDKRSFTRIISQEPERIEEISLTFARMARQLHATEADTTRLESMKQRMRRFYVEKDMVPEYYKQAVLNFLDHVPDATTCLHGDLQIGNVITDGQRTLWIDTGEFGYGVPEWDLAMFWMAAQGIDEQRCDFIFHITPETFRAHWNIFFPAYLGTIDPQRIEEATRRLIPFAYVRTPYIFDMSDHARLPEAAFQTFVKCFE